jgi:hypothetical protein
MNSKSFPDIMTITKPVLTTAEAAFYLNRSQQTMRRWACKNSGPIEPVRVNRILSWRVKDIKSLLGL